MIFEGLRADALERLYANWRVIVLCVTLARSDSLFSEIRHSLLVAEGPSKIGTYCVAYSAKEYRRCTKYQILYTAIVGVLCGWQAVWYVWRRIGARRAHPVELCYPLNRLKLLFLIRNHNNR